MLVDEREEHDLIEQTLLANRARPEEARIQARWLVEADLRGQSSHGIRRLPMLVARLRRGLLVPGASIQLDWRTESVVVVDGARGFGPLVGCRALDEARTRAERTGIALAAVRNANHLGILAPYVERAASSGTVAVAMTTSEALVHPWNGRRAMLGTNPIAIGIPAEPYPLVLDMATAEVSMGLVLHYAEVDRPLEASWALDAGGEPTVDPKAAATGSLSPFGGPKGYALGIALEVLVALLSGTALGRDVRGTLDADDVCNKGDVFICISPSVLPTDGIEAAITDYLTAVRTSPPRQEGVPVRVPGDRAREERRRRAEVGVEIADSVWEQALALRNGAAPIGEDGRAR